MMQQDGSSLNKMRTVSEKGKEDDEGDEADDLAEDENHEGKEDDGEEDADVAG
ncbi:hypothetical protein F2Q69_00021852 [Brassica cretica]|uniref:Uncharacterized protein n=1 Tax=Brassica cretica TaxID=69181 RepID=A0A8S9Q4S8_BRACR|nr:hypothetical protein F2Q69_00021850 [Brassica cretica]KAF3536768.1 hypothetical protein F2Q69_00021852 [Brassica cretica]